MKLRTLLPAAALALALSAGASQAATCVGNCGTSGANGSVTAAPTGNGTYDWVSTNLGQSGAARIGAYSNGATNGSELISDPFYATAGQKISFYFNYVTSDGAGFADYGFAQLLNASDTSVAANLFTARTLPSGTIVPGVNMPPVEATLNPSNVPISPGAPVWSPLGGSSGTCYAAGCGLTGWVQSEYVIGEAGTYQMRFGAANWSDSSYDSGLAFSGLVLDGAVIGDGSSFDDPLLPTGEVGPNGEFEFTFTPTPQQPIFIDPDYATGYTYQITGGSNSILKALFPTLAGDLNGYDVFTLDGVQLASNVWEWNFAAGVQGFKLMGIDLAAMVDPTNPIGFVTGLVFENSNQITMTQTPIITSVAGAVPEPSTWAMMIMGFGSLGVVLRRRKTLALAT